MAILPLFPELELLDAHVQGGEIVVTMTELGFPFGSPVSPAHAWHETPEEANQPQADTQRESVTLRHGALRPRGPHPAATTDNRLVECRIAGDGVCQHAGARGGDRVIAARRPLLCLRGRLLFPGGVEEPLPIQPAQDRVNRAARQAGGIHDVEAMVKAGCKRLQYERGRVGEVESGHHR